MSSKKKIITHVEKINFIQEYYIKNSDNMDGIRKTILFTEEAKQQLEKGGEVLNKADLISIIIKLNSQNIENLDELKKLKIKDLEQCVF